MKPVEVPVHWSVGHQAQRQLTDQLAPPDREHVCRQVWWPVWLCDELLVDGGILPGILTLQLS